MPQSLSYSVMVGNGEMYASTIRSTERHQRAGGLMQPTVEGALIPSKMHVSVANASSVEQIGIRDTAAQPPQ